MRTTRRSEQLEACPASRDIGGNPRMMHVALNYLTITLCLVAVPLPWSNGKGLRDPKLTGTDSLQATAVPQKEGATEPPLEWVDPATGHKVVRLSREPGSSSLYFHQNGYTASGDRMVFTTREGLSYYDFKSR